MFGIKTAFRHSGCGGVIFVRDHPQKGIFECERCWARSMDLLDLVVEPKAEPVDGEVAEESETSGVN